jgi:hypothetical protein
VLDLV